ncbi:F0F1 ATP synthase subunit A [Mycoplasma procyoni]|uniref:F0F1 ATP synthase subunit A n=1 Tax=Mycoplasma procyoni TaxID=568784 RepID=UPI00197B5E0E|nr:F0F1 ATP synthase subunit A [Mycoplasma procyoni]MBN3534534.1 F0F1 ATP synthase subunit A [Mycoplasma procyoni]
MNLQEVLNNWNQPQLFTLFLLVFFVLLISIIVHFQIKKTKKDKAPSAVVYMAEQYFYIVDNLVDESSGGKLSFVKPYIFGLLTFLLGGNLLSMIGVEPIGSTYSVTFTLALLSWLGIFIIGFSFKKHRFLKRYLNPLEIISIPAPLISLSFRMFGNIIGGSAILILLYAGTQWIWNLFPVGAFGLFNLPAAIFFAPFIFYFDIFGVVLQSYVFALLTTIYWSSALE